MGHFARAARALACPGRLVYLARYEIYRKEVRKMKQTSKKITPSDLRRLRREAELLVKTGQMPTLAAVQDVIAEVRRKYVPLIIAARKERP